MSQTTLGVNRSARSNMDECGDADAFNSPESNVVKTGKKDVLSEEKRRRLRARKRNREVAFEYWGWGPAPANLAEAKAKARTLVEQNKHVQWRCEVCDFSARSGEEIDRHLDLSKHEKALAEHLRTTVLPLRRPDMEETRKRMAEIREAVRVRMALIKEQKKAAKQAPDQENSLSQNAEPKKIVKRCDLCNRGFISVSGYNGHIQGQKHLKKAAKASTCNDEFVS